MPPGGGMNSAFGAFALYKNTLGDSNSAFGTQALMNNTTGLGNAAFGTALNNNSTGNYNSAVGYGALNNNTTSGYNVAIGYNAGASHSSGDNNIYVGSGGAVTESGSIHIGTVGTHTAAYIAGISGMTSASGVAVFVNSNGQLGTSTSSARFKDDIRGMHEESDVLMKLRPVAFYYRPELDETHTRQYGLVAEEVAEVAPQLVVYDEKGAPQTVRYHFVNAMLLNEVQKQRRLTEEQERTIVGQESKIQDLEARLSKLEAALAGQQTRP